MPKSKPILLVEDDTIDAMTVKRALKDLKVTNELIRVSDGSKALEYLRDPNSQCPWVILLDLNMPGMNGIEFLKVAKADKDIRLIPVVVLTSSKEQRDILESFEFGVAGYMLKAGDYSEFSEIIHVIEMYWRISEVPKQVVTNGF